MFRKMFVAAALGLAIATSGRGQSGEYDFKVLKIDFSSPKGDTLDCLASDVNDLGVIVGACDGRGFVLSEGGKVSEVLKKVGSLPRGVNNQGHVSGGYVSGEKLQGFLKIGGRVLDLNFPGARATGAAGVNDSDMVVGSFVDEFGKKHAFCFLSEGRYQAIDFAGETSSTGLNNLGVVVGCWEKCASGFVYDTKQKIVQKLAIAGALAIEPRDVNDLGLVVGSYTMDGLTARGFTWLGGRFGFVDFPGAGSTEVLGVNNKGQLVGRALVVEQGRVTSVAFTAQVK